MALKGAPTVQNAYSIPSKGVGFGLRPPAVTGNRMLLDRIQRPTGDHLAPTVANVVDEFPGLVTSAVTGTEKVVS